MTLLWVRLVSSHFGQCSCKRALMRLFDQMLTFSNMFFSCMKEVKIGQLKKLCCLLR